MKAVAVMSLLVSLVAGCSALPTAGPTASEVRGQEVENNQTRFDLVDIDDNVVSALLAEPRESFHARFKKYGKPPQPKIGIGDSVVVSIWEAAGGGLFSSSPTDHVSAGSRSVTIPEQVVGGDGGISVPFADRVPVAGRLPVEVQRTIEQRLAEKAIEPQVIVTVTRSLSNSVTVTGEVVNGARVPLTLKGDRLLDLIAAVGGSKAPVYETFVRLSRDGVTATIPMEALVADPAENIYAQPGNVLTLVRLPQSFTAFGATGANAQIPFTAEKMTLVEALAKAGGLQDLRSDPAGVFLFRFEPPRRRQCARPTAAEYRTRRHHAGCLPARSARCQILFPGATLSDGGQGHHLRCQCRLERTAEVLHLAEYADGAGHYRCCREAGRTLISHSS